MSVVDEIKAKLDIVDLISEYVALRKSGRNYTGFCPFHPNVRTPSFVVFPDTQTWHCFGACSTGGDIFTFIMRRENLSFGEALEFLARRAGVELRPRTPEQAAKEEKRQRLQELLELAARYFHRLLRESPKGEKARYYLEKRAISSETIDRFQLGYALDQWRGLSGYLMERGYSREDLLAAGLIIEREDGGHYDRFRGRLVIPIRDQRGRVVGFGARVLDDSHPKYINSPQTDLFDKSRLLFGLDMAKESIRRTGQAVIVEGYMDVLQAHQHGYTNVVAQMGTALTTEQLRLLSRFADTFILALDPDAAGDQATLRGIAVARESLARRMVPVPTPRGRIRYEARLAADIRVLTLPDGHDPDDLIRTAPEQWEALVENAEPVMDYIFRVVTADMDPASPRDKSRVVGELLPLLREMSDPVEQQHYLQKLARLVRMDERILYTQMQSIKPRSPRRPPPPEPPPEAEMEEELEVPEERQPLRVVSFGLEEYCLVALLRWPGFLERMDAIFADLMLDPLNEDDFRRVENRLIFGAWRALQKAEPGMEPRALLAQVDADLHPYLEAMLVHTADTIFEHERATNDAERSILRLRDLRLKREIQELRFLYEDAVAQGDARAKAYDTEVQSRLAALGRVQRAIVERTMSGQRREQERWIL